MTLQAVGSHLWVPEKFNGMGGVLSANDVTVANDVEELQIIGRVVWDGWAGSKTFSSAGAKVGWLPGASVTFNAVSSLRVGVKQASSVSTSAGPPPRATTGSAAFDVYKDLVGGTDTISSTTWREDAMSNGTLSIATGDLLAVCFYLSKTSGTSSIKVRGLGITGIFPSLTLVTSSGGTFTLQASMANLILIADDGTYGWLQGGFVHSSGSATQATVGNGEVMGNRLYLPFPCKADGVFVHVNQTSSADMTIGIWTDANPPAAVSGATVSFDANMLPAASSNRGIYVPFAAPVSLSANTAYIVGCKQTTANAVTMYGWTVDNTNHFKAHMLGPSGCYAVASSGGGAASAINSSKTRLEAYLSVSHLDDGAGGGGGLAMPVSGRIIA